MLAYVRVTELASLSRRPCRRRFPTMPSKTILVGASTCRSPRGRGRRHWMRGVASLTQDGPALIPHTHALEVLPHGVLPHDCSRLQGLVRACQRLDGDCPCAAFLDFFEALLHPVRAKGQTHHIDNRYQRASSP